ncbi:hypothetical protein [Jeongeupia chitinilytica]|uniref:hypothetical protein n=1 Tax=Jeongeupia chitinilytica TaxID=1041641 RepID=UPI001677D5DD|nr:hypothetical protein [Jeongeupia chitinilytica]
MNKSLKISIIYCISLLLGGCISTTPPRPWFEGDVSWPSISRTTIEREGKLETVETIISISCTDKSSLWIYLYARDFSKHPNLALILYSPQGAYIEKESGERLIAKSELYVRNSHAEGVPSDSCESSTPYSTLPVNTTNLNNDKGGIILRFDTTPPTPSSRWILHLGQIAIGENLIEIPKKTIILRKREWYTRPVQ